ncbi:MAG: type IV pilus biogenesis protein PilP [Alphaproteobacteria bacterium]
MRIANKSFVSKQRAALAGAAFLIALGGLPFVALTGAQAADVPLPPPGSIAPPPSMPTPQALNGPVPAPASPAEIPKVPGAEMNKNMESMEEKLSDNAKGVVKRLDSVSDSVTLDDLNSARQTVARIEAMIDIEKHMVELEKLRGERSGHVAPPPTAVASLANQVPRSALEPPPVTNVVRTPPPRKSTGSAEITRIVGTDGKYTAVLKLAGGEVKAVRVGDQIFTDGTVRSITSSSVGIEENGETHTLHIKNVDTIYSAMR